MWHLLICSVLQIRPTEAGRLSSERHKLGEVETGLRSITDQKWVQTLHTQAGDTCEAMKSVVISCTKMKFT